MGFVTPVVMAFVMVLLSFGYRLSLVNNGLEHTVTFPRVHLRQFANRTSRSNPWVTFSDGRRLDQPVGLLPGPPHFFRQYSSRPEYSRR